jgi:hypothetical protein
MAPTSAAPESQKKTALPTVALVVSILGLCLICLWPVGLVLSIVAMIQTGKPEYAASRTRAVVALAVAVLSIFVSGIVAAIAIPNFIRFQARSKQSECKLQLSSLKLATSLRLLDEQPVTSFADLGFHPGPRNRYAYVMSLPDGIIPVDPAFPPLAPARIEAALREAGVEPGVKGQCPACTVTFACVGNVDLDDGLDVWSITVAGTDDGIEASERGQPVHNVNDLE